MKNKLFSLTKDNSLLNGEIGIINKLNENELILLQKKLQNSLLKVSNVMFKTIERKNNCVICFENERNEYFEPCGHYVCCKDCSRKIDQCPICKSNIANKRSIYQ